MWQVRQALKTDMPAVQVLVAAVAGDQEGWQQDQFVVAEGKDGVILGCGRLRPYPAFCELASLAVSEEAQSRGVGRDIVNSLLARYQGAIYLICEDNVVDFFRRFGLERIPETGMPEGLRPKWDFYLSQAGAVNLMLRE